MSSITTRAGKGSELTHTELDDNFTNLNTDKLENITGESLSDLSNVNATTPTDGQALAYDNATSTWTAQTISGGGGINNVVEDTTPQLGGNLDVQDRDIVSTGVGNQITLGSTNNEKLLFEGDSKSQNVLLLEPNFYTTDTGRPEAKITTNAHVLEHTGTSATFTLTSEPVTGYPGKFNVMMGGTSMLRADTTDGVVFYNSMIFPSTDGTADQVLKTDGAGNLSWTTAAGGGASNNWVTGNGGSDFTSAPTAGGDECLSIGSGASTAGGYHDIAIGTSASATSGRSIAIGYSTSCTDGFSVAIGYDVTNTKGDTVAIGRNASVTTDYSTALGARTTCSNTGATAVGRYATTNGMDGTAIGTNAKAGTASECTSLGTFAGYWDQSSNTTYSYTNATCVGAASRVSGSQQIQLGQSGTTTYAYGAVQNRSDERDKTEITDTVLGLDFINAIRPVDFKWDMRDDYYDITTDEEGVPSMNAVPKDGSRKGTRKHHGVIAQEVKQVIDDMGVDFGGYQDHNINGGNDVLSVGYTEFISPLIKAVQELTAKCDDLQTQINALNGQ